jgi:hypothetical protein
VLDCRQIRKSGRLVGYGFEIETSTPNALQRARNRSHHSRQIRDTAQFDEAALAQSVCDCRVKSLLVDGPTKAPRQA